MNNQDALQCFQSVNRIIFEVYKKEMQYCFDNELNSQLISMSMWANEQMKNIYKNFKNYINKKVDLAFFKRSLKLTLLYQPDEIFDTMPKLECKSDTILVQGLQKSFDRLNEKEFLTCVQEFYKTCSELRMFNIEEITVKSKKNLPPNKILELDWKLEFYDEAEKKRKSKVK